ncbi:MAG: SIMPL domain-containing protein, partial [Candidatus Binatia bacterium]
MKLLTVLTTLAVTALPLPAAADHAPEPPTIRVTGEAIVREKPDQAEIEVGVTTQAKTAPEATSENAKKVDAVLAALRKVLGDAG